MWYCKCLFVGLGIVSPLKIEVMNTVSFELLSTMIAEMVSAIKTEAHWCDSTFEGHEIELKTVDVRDGFPELGEVVGTRTEIWISGVKCADFENAAKVVVDLLPKYVHAMKEAYENSTADNGKDQDNSDFVDDGSI